MKFRFLDIRTIIERNIKQTISFHCSLIEFIIEISVVFHFVFDFKNTFETKMKHMVKHYDVHMCYSNKQNGIE